MYATLLLLLLLPLGWQEPDAEAEYREQYAKFTEISGVSDPADKAIQFLDFFEAGVDARLTDYVIGGVQESLQALAEAQRNDELFPIADRWHEETGDAAPLVIALQAAAEAGDHPNTVKYGEEVYEQNPAPQLALVLAGSYSELEDDDKYREYGERAIEGLGLAETWQIAYSFMEIERAEMDWNEAAEWATVLKNGLTSAPEGLSAAEWRERQFNIQTVIARAAFEGGRYPAAEREFQALLQMEPRNGMALFYLGRSLLENNKLPQAMDRFADGAVVDDPNYSVPSRRMFEEMYRVNTGGSLEGSDRELAQARSRMGQ